MHGHVSGPTLPKEKARVTSGTTVGKGFSMEVNSQLNEERERVSHGKTWGMNVSGGGIISSKFHKQGSSWHVWERKPAVTFGKWLVSISAELI